MHEAKRLTERSGKGFHLHMRDNAPDWTYLEANGTKFADFVERASNWVWLERARRLGSMTSLKSWSNARMTTNDVNNLANLNDSSRATIRTQISKPGYIDVEIRGFTKYVGDIETLAKIFTEALKTGNYGPWGHMDNPLPNTGQGAPHESLRLVDHVEDYLRTVEGKEMTPEMRRMERSLLLQIVDSSWKDHLLTMDYLRSAVQLKGYAQLDPKVEYKREGMRLFDAMWVSIGNMVTDLIFKMEQLDERFVGSTWVESAAIHEDAPAASEIAQQQQAAIAGTEADKKLEPIRNRTDRTPRNAPCPCGSGKKFKNCCMRQS